MPRALVNGVRLAYEARGEGDPILLIMGARARARVWDAYQVTALTAAGYRVVTFDNRGMPPSESPPGHYTLDQMVDDTVALVEHLGLGPCRVAGVSLGAFVAQELALARPDLVRSAALMATRARADKVRQAFKQAELELLRTGIRLPPMYAAVTAALQALSPQTLNDEQAGADWIDIFKQTALQDHLASGQATADDFPDRRQALSGVRVPCIVIAFADDLVTPPTLGREVAQAIPGCDYVELPGCGHLGFLERPELVNETLLKFFAQT
jgi:pimeloyl-ACP methyl ester carboxylesterase